MVVELQQEFVTYHAGGSPGRRRILRGNDRVETFTTIPTIDFSALSSSSLSSSGECEPAVLASLADRVRHACENVGFFYAADHPIPEDVVSRLFAAMDRFFALPTEEKMAAHLHLNPAMRGYEPLFETKNDPSSSALGDLKEAFSMGDDPLDPEQRRYWPFADDVPSQWKHQNIWPPAAPWLRDALYEYYHHVVPFARALTAVFALAMGLQENALDGMFNFPITGMRALHYPPQEPGGLNIGLGAHSDFSWFTLVLQGDVSALEVLNANGEWISAPPVPRTFVVNTGDFMQAHTKGRFPSTVHRVRNLTGKRRYSLPFFWAPDPTVSLVDSGETIGQAYIRRVIPARHKHPTSLKYKNKPLDDLKYEMLYT